MRDGLQKFMRFVSGATCFLGFMDIFLETAALKGSKQLERFVIYSSFASIAVNRIHLAMFGGNCC
jgi:hypothetical protein